MSYASIDQILQRWSRERGLAFTTLYRDEEVRSAEIVDQLGRRYQIWIDPPEESGRIGVHAWNYKKRRIDLIAGFDDLEARLDEIRQVVGSWIRESGD